MVHLALLIRQLTRAVTGCLVDNVRRLYLKITGFAGLIEEESLQSALEAGHLTHIDREAGARDLHSHIEVYKAELLEQIPMAQRVLTKIWHRTTFLDDDVVVGILTFGNKIVGDVWYLQQLVGHVGLSLVHDLLQSLVGSFQLGNLSLDLLCLVLLAVLH